MGRKPRSREGRPSKLTPELQAWLLRLLRAGNYLETSARMVGIDPATLHEWLQRGARARGVTDQKFAAFAREVRKAMAVAEVQDLGRVGRSRDWRARAWRLERRHPKRWGPKVQLMVQEQLEAFLGHLEKTLDGPTYQRVLEAAVRWDGEEAPAQLGEE